MGAGEKASENQVGVWGHLEPGLSFLEAGIEETKSCILVATKNFTGNQGWMKVESGAFFIEEISGSCPVVLWKKR